MNFKYRQAIGELLFAAVTCRPNVRFAVIRLSQYSSKPAKIRYQAAKHVFKYLQTTIDDRLHFWRPATRKDILNLPLPNIPNDTHECKIPKHLPQEILWFC